MYSNKVASYSGVYDFSRFGRTLTTVPIVERTSPVSVLHSSKTNLDSISRTSLNNDSISAMSLPFREVYKEYANESSTDNKLNNEENYRKTKHVQLLEGNVDDSLLFSSGNVRPKSRSKTLLTIGDIKKSLIENDGQPVLYKSITNNNVKLETVPTANGSNNAQNHNGAIENIKKGKKSRKRSKSSMKVKKGRLGNLLSGVQSGTDRHSITSVSSRGSHIATPNRVSSEPPSKIGTKVTSTAVLTFDRHGTGNGFGHSNHSHTGLPSTSRQVTSMYPPSSFISNSAKSNTSVSVCNNTHSRLHVRDEHLNDNDEANTVDGLLSLQAQGKPIVLYKLDVAPRIRSASSIKSDSTIKTLGGKETKEIMDKNTELTLTAFTCAVQQAKSQSNKPTIKYHNNSLSPTAKVLSDNDYKSKEASLASIYAPVFQTADKVSAQVEELKKVKKIFLSDKQSGTIRESGTEFPCAPPTTPTPDVLRRHEYVPSMSDIRSQRAVKGRLAAMEKEAQKKREKQKQENVKMEKQMVKDREKQLKIKQRREIYALNKIMTDLEYKRFLEFCQAKGLNKV